MFFAEVSEWTAFCFELFWFFEPNTWASHELWKKKQESCQNLPVSLCHKYNITFNTTPSIDEIHPGDTFVFVFSERRGKLRRPWYGGRMVRCGLDRGSVGQTLRNMCKWCDFFRSKQKMIEKFELSNMCILTWLSCFWQLNFWFSHANTLKATTSFVSISLKFPWYSY